jgi:DNA-directed RNA polymerase specialized sigma24 family protein
VSTRRPPDPAREWLTVGQAAAELGLSPSGFRGLAKTEGLTIRRRSRQPGLLRADIDGYLERVRLGPGDVTTARRAGDLRTGRQVSSDFAAYESVQRAVTNVPGLAEAMTLRDEHGWTDADIAELLGLHYSNVYRRRLRGFSPEQIAAMRQVIDRSGDT